MLPLLPAAAAGAGALFLLKRLGGRVIRRRRHVQDPRTAVTLRMKRVNPLRRGHSRATISHNIRELMRSGRGQKQAIAIAFRAAGLSRNPMKASYDKNSVGYKAMVDDGYGRQAISFERHPTKKLALADALRQLKAEPEGMRALRFNPRRMPVSVGTAAARVAQWRWHHNPKGDAAKFRYLAAQPTGVHRYGGATYQTAIRNGRLVYKQLYAPGYPASGWRGIKTIPPRHNPIPAGYQSRAGRRIVHDLENGELASRALDVGKIVARQAGDHVALEAIEQAQADLARARNENEARMVAWAVGRDLGGEPRRKTKYNPKRRRNPADHMAAANEIKNQIGARALFMLGAKNLAGGVVPKGGKIVAGESIVASPSDLAGSPYLIFKVGRNAKGVTHVVIFLDPSDTYTVQFLAVRGTKTRTVSSQSDVYVDALRPTLEAGTGMATSLGTMRANPRRRNPVHPSDLKRVGDLKPYHFTFRVGKKRIDWVRYGKDMNSTHDLAVLAAKREYANASGFQTTSVNPCRR